MSNRLKAGVVISQRINPKDCMSVVDVLDKTGLLQPGMSFSSMCSLAFSSLLETMRQQGHIPERTGFEFTEMVGPYLTGKNAKKVHATAAIQSLGSDFSAPSIPTRQPQAQQARVPVPAPTPASTENRAAARRLTELLQKKDLVDQGNTGVVWSAGDQQEYDECYRMVYPEG